MTRLPFLAFAAVCAGAGAFILLSDGDGLSGWGLVAVGVVAGLLAIDPPEVG